jgi:hypothetical protein
MRGTQFGTVSLECTHGPVGKHFYSRKREEFAADFCLVTRRVLTEAEYKIFRYTFLLGADWKMCADHLGLDRGNFYHAIYRIEEKLGREYADLKPYPLYPVDEYFGSQIRKRRFDIPRHEIRLRGEPKERAPMVRRRPVTAEQLPFVDLAAPMSAA